MRPPLQVEEDNVPAASSVGGAAIPESLKIEYRELTLKREQLRARLALARTDLETLRAKGKAP